MPFETAPSRSPDEAIVAREQRALDRDTLDPKADVGDRLKTPQQVRSLNRKPLKLRELKKDIFSEPEMMVASQVSYEEDVKTKNETQFFNPTAEPPAQIFSQPVANNTLTPLAKGTSDSIKNPDNAKRFLINDPVDPRLASDTPLQRRESTMDTGITFTERESSSPDAETSQTPAGQSTDGRTSDNLTKEVVSEEIAQILEPAVESDAPLNKTQATERIVPLMVIREQAAVETPPEPTPVAVVKVVKDQAPSSDLPSVEPDSFTPTESIGSDIFVDRNPDGGTLASSFAPTSSPPSPISPGKPAVTEETTVIEMPKVDPSEVFERATEFMTDPQNRVSGLVKTDSSVTAAEALAINSPANDSPVTNSPATEANHASDVPQVVQQSLPVDTGMPAVDTDLASYQNSDSTLPPEANFRESDYASVRRTNGDPWSRDSIVVDTTFIREIAFESPVTKSSDKAATVEAQLRPLPASDTVAAKLPEPVKQSDAINRAEAVTPPLPDVVMARAPKAAAVAVSHRHEVPESSLSQSLVPSRTCSACGNADCVGCTLPDDRTFTDHGPQFYAGREIQPMVVVADSRSTLPIAKQNYGQIPATGSELPLPQAHGTSAGLSNVEIDGRNVQASYESSEATASVTSDVPPIGIETLMQRNAVTWRSRLSQTVELVQDQLAQNDVDNETRTSLEINLRLLDVLSRQMDDIVENQQQFSASENQYWQDQLEAITSMLAVADPKDARANEMLRHHTAHETLSHLRQAVAHLESLANLKVVSGAFCTDVSGYGQFRTFERDVFPVGQKVLLYCEIENFVSLAKPSDNAGEETFHTSLRGSYAIYDADGHAVQQAEFPTLEDVARRRRRDFYMHLPITIGKLAPGNYELHLLIEDLGGNKTASLSPPLQFVIDGPGSR